MASRIRVESTRQSRLRGRQAVRREERGLAAILEESRYSKQPSSGDGL